MSENPEAVDLLADFALEALGVLAHRYGTPRLASSLYFDWERQDDEVFAASERKQWLSFEWFGAWDEIAALDSYQSALEAIEASEATQGQVGELVGTAWGQMSINPRSEMAGIVQAAVTAAESFEVDPALLRQEAAVFVDALSARSITEHHLVQLLGMRLPADDGVELEDGVILRRLRDDEISALLRYNLFRLPSDRRSSLFGPIDRHVPTACQFGLVVEEELPKIVGERPDSARPDRTDLGSIAESLVTALRLKNQARIARGPRVSLSGGWKSSPWQSASFGPAQPVPSIGDVVVSNSELRDAAALAISIRTPEVREVLGIGLDRFRDLPLRVSDEDKIIDLMIAAEALFLFGDTPQELAHKTAIRAALFVGLDGVAPSALYRFMKKAYDARSKIVHGSKPKKLIGLDGEEADLRGVVDDCELLVASALTTAATGITVDGSLQNWTSFEASFLDAWQTDEEE